MDGSKVHYQRPSLCQECGRPYPWTEERLNTAWELICHDDKLSIDERNELWSDLRYVMSNPKADLLPLVPVKKKLIDITLGNATGYVKVYERMQRQSSLINFGVLGAFGVATSSI